METLGADYVRRDKPACAESLCRFKTWSEEAFFVHTHTDHVRCSCGRMIVEPNYSKLAARSPDCRPD